MSINIRNITGRTALSRFAGGAVHGGFGSITIDPALGGLLGTFGTATTGGDTTVPPQGGAPPPGVDLGSIVSAIPVAQDGQLITSAHHNIMRSALLAISAHLGGGGGGLEITATQAPAFHQLMVPPSTDGPLANLPPWGMTAGVALNPAPLSPATVTDAGGWLPVNLTDGARIESLRVLGSRTGTVGSLEFDLVRVPFDAHQVPVLIKIAGDTNTDPFSRPVQFDQTGLTSAVIQEATLVDNTKYLYAIQAIGRNIAAAAQITIRGFQITCTLG
jgi:hypothetical protein